MRCDLRLAVAVTFDGVDPGGITISVTCAVDGTLLVLANGFLNLGIAN